MTFKKTLPLWRVLMVVFVSLFAAMLALYGVATTWRGTVDTALGTSSYESTGESKFVSDYDTTDELIEAHEELGERVGEEGTVLLKNTESTLPLTQETPHVTLFGMGSMYPFQGGVMGSTSEGKVNFVDALEQKGFEVNPTMVDIYTTLGSIQTGTSTGRGGGPIYGHRPAGFSDPYVPSEPSTAIYTTDGGAEGTWQDSFDEYGDAAIVVLSRPGSEGSDYRPGPDGVDAATGATSALGLCTNERALITLAKENFEKVIVLVNSGSVMEIEELKDDEDVGAIMFIGYPGDYGFLGIADILKGEVSPSGHLSDTFAVDNSKSPAAQNVGDVGVVSDTSEIVVSDSLIGTIDPTTSSSTFDWTPRMAASQYIVEAESIYVGYKYYESRYYDSIMDPDSNASVLTSDKRDTANSNATSWVYDDEVSYSFGHGLSYTTFTQTFDSISVDLSSKTVTAEVTVTNTGNVPGKDVVQLYVQTPYTDHDKESGVEKSAIEFIGMEKTGLLGAAGSDTASETVTITVDMQYIASWDSTAKDGQGGYILDGGDYYFAIGNGAHAAVNNIIAAQGNSTAGGNSAMVKVETIGSEGSVDESTFAQSKNGTEVVNQLEDADINYYRPGYATYLSRENWSSTFPRTYDDLEVTSEGSAHFDEWITNLANETYKVKADGEANLDGSGGTLTLQQVAGETNIDSDYWEMLVNQIPAETVYTIILKGGSRTEAIDEINSPVVYQNDGPNGFGSTSLLGRNNANEDDPNRDYMLNTMSNLVILGCTFDKDLVREWGELMGNDGLWTENYVIWGAAANIHRTPFNGRNFEYYSEDPMLSNYMLTETVLGALDYGIIVGPKHFAFNDQESYRGGIAPYMTEQKAREGDLRAFQGALEGGALGIMTSFSRIGATAVHGSVPLLKNIVREEWGYNGLITTDMASNAGYFRAEAMINAGISMVADFGTEETFSDIAETWEYFDEELIAGDPDLLEMARDNLKYQLYAFANSGIANLVTVRVMPWWESLIIALIVITAVIAAGSIVMFVVSTVKKDKEA